MVTKMDLVRKLRSTENKIVLQAVEELRVRGWLEDGSLKSIPLCHVHMEGADLLRADLSQIDFHQADLHEADLSMANLSGARLTRANLQAANLSHADLSNADLFKANLKEARNLTDRQLMQAKRLWGAVMPNGDTYDGRYNLAGDLEFAQWGRVDARDPHAMAEFLRVPLDVYLEGQEISHRLAVS
jgi:hypothetical protein